MIEAGFRPTHLAPATGLLAWDAPDPGRTAAHRLDPDLPLQLLEETTGWAHVRCSNGWQTWVDATQLVAIPFRPTHAIPGSGLDARQEPEASRLPDARLDPGLQVEMIEESWGWARVRCSNGWETWVDGAALAPIGPGRSTGWPSAAPLNLVNLGPALLTIALPAGAVILGSLLAWFSALGASINAWDIELVALITHDDSSFDLKTGPVLLVVALAALVLIPVRLAPPVARIILATLGAVAFGLGALGVLLYLDLPEPRPDLGIGLLLTMVGGVALAVAGYLAPNGVRPDVARR